MKKMIFGLLVLGFAFSSQAAFLIEPYVGFNLETDVESTSSLGDSDGDFSGNAFGARIGYQVLGFMGGLDAKFGNHEVDLGSGADGEFETREYGLFVGYDFPILIRAWAELIIAGSGELDDNGGKFEKVSGTKLGVGYTGLPFVSINLEIGKLKFDDIDTSGSDLEYEVDTTMLSVSLPLTL